MILRQVKLVKKFFIRVILNHSVNWNSKYNEVKSNGRPYIYPVCYLNNSMIIEGLTIINKEFRLPGGSLRLFEMWQTIFERKGNRGIVGVRRALSFGSKSRLCRQRRKEPGIATKANVEEEARRKGSRMRSRRSRDSCYPNCRNQEKK